MQPKKLSTSKIRSGGIDKSPNRAGFVNPPGAFRDLLKLAFIPLTLMLLTVGCTQQTASPATATPTPTASLTRAARLITASPPTPTATRVVVPTNTPTPAGAAACSPQDPTFFNWAQQELEPLSGQVQAALDAAGITGAEARASAYGENSISQSTNQVCGFMAMETDFYITLQTDTLTDLDKLGALVEKVLAVLDQFPPDQTPGPQPGYISITFVTADAAKIDLRFRVPEAAEARGRGLKGAVLLEALGYKP